MAENKDSPVREILLATDFSDVSDAAARLALDYARQFHACVHLLHVASPEETGLTRLLADLAARFGSTPTVVRCVPTGEPAQEIVRYANENSIDLIVVGTHGRTGLDRLLLGHVAERVVRTAPCPVLTVSAVRQPGGVEAVGAKSGEPGAQPR